MQQQIQDKSSVAYQRIAWEALKKSINGLINKVTSRSHTHTMCTHTYHVYTHIPVHVYMYMNKLSKFLPIYTHVHVHVYIGKKGEINFCPG